MERTNYVNKAKQLLLNTAGKSVLAIVPLAAACAAQAGSLIAVTPISGLPTGNFACSVGYSCLSGAGVSSISHSGGIGGVSFYTTNGASGLSIGYTSGGTYNLSLTMSAYGSSSGSLPASIPVDWDFIIFDTNPSGITVGDWSLTFDVSDTAVGNGDLGAVTETGTGTGTFEGADTLKLTGGTPANIYETAVLTVPISGTGDGNVFVDVVQGSSFDFNGAPVTSTAPEPASLGLFGAGVAFMGAHLRRRKA